VEAHVNEMFGSKDARTDSLSGIKNAFKSVLENY